MLTTATNSVSNNQPVEFNFRTFRDKLSSSHQEQALNDFINACKTSSLDICTDFFMQNGSCMEIVQLLDVADCPQVLVIEAAAILFQSNVEHPDFQRDVSKASRYLLEAHVNLLNKMLAPNSSTQERFVCLNLLRGIVLMSPFLAKEILLFVKLQVDLLTKPMLPVNRSVRLAFIKFLLAFFADGNYANILQLLNKSFLLPSVTSHLQFDPVDYVCPFLDCLKQNIIDNQQVPKPLILKLFNSRVMRGLIKLYDWKGPQGFDAVAMKERDYYADEELKSKVTNITHQIALQLCTSIKRGLVFRDPNLGLSKTHKNPTIFTVLLCLENYSADPLRRDLVAKIAHACPDLIKVIWNNLSEQLQPRDTETWFKAIDLVDKIVANEVSEKTVSFYINNLNPAQFWQLLINSVAPEVVLKKLIVDDFRFEASLLKLRVCGTLKNILKSLFDYLSIVKAKAPIHYYNQLKRLIGDYLQKKFPSAALILQDEIKEKQFFVDFFNEALDILIFYSDLCPELTADVKFDLLFNTIKDFDNLAMKIKLLQTIVKCDANFFILNFEAFSLALELLSQNNEAKEVLNVIKVYTDGAFDEFPVEANFWTDYLSSSKFVQFFKDVLLYYKENLAEIRSEMALFDGKSAIGSRKKLRECLLNLGSADRSIKTVGFSSLLLVAVKILPEKRKLKTQLSRLLLQIFYIQSDLEKFRKFLLNYQSKVDEKVYEFIVNYPKEWQCPFDFEDSCDFKARKAVFELLHLNKEDKDAILGILEEILQNSNESLKFALDNPQMLKQFSPLLLLSPEESQGDIFCTNFVSKLCLEYKLKNDDLLSPYRWKLKDCLLQVFDNNNLHFKASNVEFLNIVSRIGINNQDFQDLFKVALNLEPERFVFEGKTNICYGLLVVILKLFIESKNKNVYLNIGNFAKIFVYLNLQNVETSELSLLFKEYLEEFPVKSPENFSDLFESICKKSEFCKEDAYLAVDLYNFLNVNLTGEVLERNFDVICSKKGLILPLLKIRPLNDSISQKVYEQLKNAIGKSLQKPQKAGAYVENHFGALCQLIKLHMSQKEAEVYFEKVLKFDYNNGQIFLPKMMQSIFEKLENPSETQLVNFLLSFINILQNLFKKLKDSDLKAIEANVEIFSEVLEAISSEKSPKQCKLNALKENETFRAYYKQCLKYAIGSRKAKLLENVKLLTKLVKFEESDAGVLLEMLISHSEFLNLVMSGEFLQEKCKVFELWFILTRKNPKILCKNHLAILLASYGASMHPSDRVLLNLLKLYESQAQQTYFYDFKPFLWGLAAANFYTLRTESFNVNRKLPKPQDILNNLDDEKVLDTIKHHCLQTTFLKSKSSLQDCSKIENVYDLTFLLPLFSLILAPENPLPIYKFTRSGALSLTLLALSNVNEEMRMAAGYVLGRLLGQLEGQQSGKDVALWSRFVDAVARGTAATPNMKLSNFASVFLARAAIILTNPQNVMYLPMSNYLTAKETPNFAAGVPEFNTFLHSSEVDAQHYREFLLDVILDGMRTDSDFEAISAKFGLLLELFDSSLSNLECKLQILDVILKAVQLNKGLNFLVSNLDLLGWLYNVIIDYKETQIVAKVVKVLHVISRNAKVNASVLVLCVKHFAENCADLNLEDEHKVCFFELLIALLEKRKICLQRFQVEAILLKFIGDHRMLIFSLENKCKFKISNCNGSHKSAQTFVNTWLDCNN